MFLTSSLSGPQMDDLSHADGDHELCDLWRIGIEGFLKLGEVLPGCFQVTGGSLGVAEQVEGCLDATALTGLPADSQSPPTVLASPTEAA